MHSLFEFTYGLADFLVASKTKLDSSFQIEQFNLSGFRTPYRKDGDILWKSRGLLDYVNSNILSKVLQIPYCPSDVQVIPVEINLKKQNLLVATIDKPPSLYFILEVFYDRIHQNTVILEDFNMEPINQILKTFLEDNGFTNLIKSNTCFKSTPGSYTDLILTNKPKHKNTKHKTQNIKTQK